MKRNRFLRPAVGLVCVVLMLLPGLNVLCEEATPEKSDPPDNTWVNMKPGGVRPSMPGWETLNFCPLSKQAVVWGDYRTFSTEYQHSLLGYDTNANRWHVLDASPYHESDLTPTCGHDFSGSTVDTRHGWLLLPACFPAYGPSHRYTYDLLGRCGRLMEGPGNLPYGINGALAYSPDDGLVFSCDTDTQASLYDPLTRQSNTIQLPPELRRRHYARLVYAQHQKCFFLFGGVEREKDGKEFNDLWKFEPVKKQWTKMEPEGELPPARPSPQLVYNHRYGVLLNVIWHKKEEKTPLSLPELWVYLPDKNRWRKEQISNAPEGGVTSAVKSSWTIYDPHRDLVVCTAIGHHALKDTWAIRYASADLKPIPLPEAPVPRRMVIPKSVGLERWREAECLNDSAAAPVVMSTSLSANKDRAYLAWDEGQSSLNVREWDGSSWSPPTTVAEGNLQPNLTMLEDRAVLASWSASWKRRIHVVENRDARWQPLWTTDDAGEQKSTPFHPVVTAHQDVLHLATIVPKWDLEVWQLADGKMSRLGEKLNQKSVGTSNDAGHVNRFFLASCGGTLYCAWGEYWTEKQVSSWHVFVKKWEKNSWVQVGGPVNDPKTEHASCPHIIEGPDGKPRISYLARQITGTQHGSDQVYVKRLDGDRWLAIGESSLNALGKDGNAWSPRLGLVGTDVCVAWSEYRPARPITREGAETFVDYDRPQVYFARWDGNTWRREGPLNADPLEGSAAYVSLAAYQGKPVVAWAEAFGMHGPRKVYARVGK
jgi:hypothetical protein